MGENNQPDLILGTAGHIDHGKSSLVFALTGVDPDRLAEEKERGITITLGFAQLHLPDGRSMGVVDLPGHEKFVRQMISGATGIDVALLVVAADDGVMPQTVEHLAILQTLGIRSCVVALTKIDLVDDDLIELVTDDVRQLLSDTPFADAVIVPVSARTREGLDEVLQAIQDAASHADRTHTGSAMRYPVDRVFTIKGAGTVVTGTLWSGEVEPGDTVEILPSKKQCRVRSIQIHGTTVERAQAGNRVAINLNNIKTSEVRPGDFVASPDTIEPSDRFDAYITYIDSSQTGKPIISGAPMHIAHGTREVVGRILLADGQQTLEPGSSAIAQFRIDEPLALSYGDRFVMRTYSPVLLAGGGEVLLAHPRRRTTFSPKEHELLDALQGQDMKRAVECAVATESTPVGVQFVARLIGIDPVRAQALLDEVAEEGRIVSLGTATRFYATQDAVEDALARIDEVLGTFHKENPKEDGMPKEALRRKCFPKMSAACFDELLASAIDRKIAVVARAVVSRPSALSAAQEAEAETADELLPLIQGTGLTPPDVAEIAQQVGIDAVRTRRGLDVLCSQGLAWRANNDLYFDNQSIEQAKQSITQHFANGGEGTVAALRDLLGITRKFAVPLLEGLDACGFTRRSGDNTRELA